MEICPLNPNGRRGGKADRLVIALDRPVQVGACPFGGPALISVRTHHRRHSGMRRMAQGPSARWLWIPGSRFARPEMTRDGVYVSTSPVVEPLAAESLWPCGSA